MDMSKYKALFFNESQERLATLDNSILALEKNPGDFAQVDEMFRAFHSIKGMAASMGFSQVAALAHALEDLLDCARSRRESMPPAWIEAFLAGRDHLESLIKTHEKDDVIDAMLPEIHAFIVTVKALEKPAATALPPPDDRAADAPVAPGGTQVTIVLSAKVSLPAARGFLVHKRLSERFGAIVSVPSLEQIKRGEFERQLRFTLPAVVSEGDVHECLKSFGDLERVEIHHTAPKSTAAPGGLGFDDFVRPAQEKEVVVAAPASGKIKVPTEFLDRMINGMGELLIDSFRMQNLLQASRANLEIRTAMRRQLKDLRALYDRVLTIRMTPLEVLTEKLPRVVRDLARKTGKSVQLDMSGADLLLDRSILEDLDAPILHLIRNAVDHGLETPDERKRAGKPERGMVALRAAVEQGLMVLEIADDGRGLDAEKIKAKVVERGLLRPQDVANLSESQALMLVCLPGFSTAEQVTDISGRGVGMDAVRGMVESCNGTLEIQSTIGQGTIFRLRLPLNVSIVKVLLFSVASQTLALPISRIARTLEIEAQPQAAFTFEEQQVPLLSMREMLGYEKREAVRPGDHEMIGSASAAVPVVLIGQHGRHYGLQVDRLLGQQEVVLKPLSRSLKSLPWISGATILSSGKPAFVLDINRILQEA